MSASVKSEVRMVTPQDAKLWLAMKATDKRANRQQVRAYAEDMRAGKWMMNGEPIIIGQAGNLLSGVLRLQACLDAETAFPSLIITGVDDKVFETIDSVRRRTVADILTIRKEKNGRALAAALMVLFRYANDDYLSPSRKPSATSLLQILENNQGLKDSIRLAGDASSLISPALAGAMHYLFSRVDAGKADQFFEQLVDPDPQEGPALLLRQQLERLRKQRGMKSQGLLIGLMIKAWEAFRSGEEMKQLRFVPGNDNQPRISGIDDVSLRSGLLETTVTSANVRRTSFKSFDELKIEILQITPELAGQMLECNEQNRGMAALVVDKYARDMKSGAWALNGQTIKFGRSGRLLDGQHRLQASVKSNTAFPAIVVRGLEDSVFDTFDLGSRRAIGDVLRDRGEVNTSTLGAALRQLWLLEHGLLQSKGATPTIAEMLDVLEDHPELRDSVRLAHKVRDITAPTIMVALHYLFSRVDKERANEFVDRLSDGAMLTQRDPILTLRDQLTRARHERKFTLSDAERAAWVIKAWNAHMENRTVATLKWQVMGPRKEPFPEIFGLRASRRDLAA